MRTAAETKAKHMNTEAIMSAVIEQVWKQQRKQYELLSDAISCVSFTETRAQP